jgi:hypothetical protein
MADKLFTEQGTLREGMLSRFVDRIVSKFVRGDEDRDLEKLADEHPEVEDRLDNIRREKEAIEDVLRRAEKQKKATF